MDKHKRLHENISALADGELPQSEQELAFAALKTAEGRAAWQTYHLVGAVLRDGASGALSAGFSAALAARLEREAGLETAPFAPGAADPATLSAPSAAAASSAGAGLSSSSSTAVANGVTAAAATTTTAATALGQGQVQGQANADVIFP